MNPTLIDFLPYIFTVVITAGAALAFRQSYSNAVGQIHTQVIAAYKEQNEALQKENDALHKRIIEHDRQFAAIRYALKQLGFVIKVNGQAITLQNIRTQHTRVISMLPSSEENADIEEEEQHTHDDEN